MHKSDLADLAVPRLLYKGPDDEGRLVSPVPATPLDQVLANAQGTDRLIREKQEQLDEPTQTCRVETHDELAEKLAQGWRLHRTLDKADAADADAARAEAIDVTEEAAAAGVPVEAIARQHDGKKKK